MKRRRRFMIISILMNGLLKKEGDKWKVVFMTLEEPFELMVMFFELTNFPVTFQMIMNKTL